MTGGGDRTPPEQDCSLAALLQEHQGDLERILVNEARGLQRFESVHDLVQGVNVRALEVAPRFEYQGEAEFRGWLGKVARQHIADRYRYWSAMKRGSAKVLRLTWGVTSTDSGESASAPPATSTGVSTFAGRREQLSMAVRALALLSERDRRLVRWSTEGVSLAEQARRLGATYEAVQRARVRATERLKKTFLCLAPTARSQPGA